MSTWLHRTGTYGCYNDAREEWGGRISHCSGRKKVFEDTLPPPSFHCLGLEEIANLSQDRTFCQPTARQAHNLLNYLG